MSAPLFLIVRAAHVLLAAVWVGATVFITFLLMPSLQDAGPAAGPVMGALMRRKLSAFMAAIGGVTVLTGMYLYWLFTAGFDPAVSASRAGRAFGTGGLCGIVALIIGGAVIGRATQKMVVLGGSLATAPEADRAAITAQIATLRRRAATASRIVVVLQIIAIVLMAIGHYV